MKKLDPKAFWLFFITNIRLNTLLAVIFTLISPLFLIGFMSAINLDSENIANPLNWSWGILVVFLLFLIVASSFVQAKLDYHFYLYEITESGLKKEWGIIKKNYVYVSYERIQNIDIRRDFLMRLLGLSTLGIQTAGASGIIGHEFILPGISKEEAIELREKLIELTRQNKTGL